MGSFEVVVVGRWWVFGNNLVNSSKVNEEHYLRVFSKKLEQTKSRVWKFINKITINTNQ